MSGYKDCACRDCFEIAIGDDGKPALCHACEASGCDLDGESECCCEPGELDGEDPSAVSRYLGALRVHPLYG